MSMSKASASLLHHYYVKDTVEVDEGSYIAFSKTCP